jgi:UDP-2,4-diacetamido-2,4,6-trideoxy-beta-L-altropyranose hydrolase
MRCLALAQAWLDEGGHVIFAATGFPKSLAERIEEECELVQVAAETGSGEDAAFLACLAVERRVAWVVVDGYQFDSGYQRHLHERDLKLLWIDDSGHAAPYCADLILNQNIAAQPSYYQDRASHAQLLLGTPYVMLRREFRRLIGWCRESRDAVRNVLVTLGGADPGNHTATIVDAIGRISDLGLEATVVVGGTNLHRSELERLIGSTDAEMHLMCSVRDMSALMQDTDVAICSGGTTVWELAFLGVPTLVGRIAPVEDLLINGIRDIGLFDDLGWFRHVETSDVERAMRRLCGDADHRRKMTKLGQATIDGRGCERILRRMKRRKETAA